MRAMTATAPAAGDGASTREALRAIIQSVVPFLQDFLVTESHPDEDDRCFSLPEQALLRSRDPLSHGPIPARSALKNLLLLPDSSHSLFPAVQGALLAAARLG